MTDGTPSVFVFLNRKVLKTDKMRIKGPLPPQIQERETERIPYTVTLLPSGILVAVQPYDRAYAVTYQFGISPLHEIVPAFQPFPVRRPVVVPAFTDFQYVIQVIVLVTASDTCCQPFEFLQPSVPCKPFLA